MAVLIDTSILGWLANIADKDYMVADRAVAKLHSRGELLHITPQVLIEFRNVATRPTNVNGLGLSIVAAEAKAAMFELSFPLLPETPVVFPTWKSIVSGLGIIGKQVHDARLVAVCHVHGVSQLLTFNEPHFVRLAGFGPGLTVLHPARV